MDSNNNRPNQLIMRGTVIRVLPVQEGVSKAGNAWRKGAFVIETDGQYSRTVCFNIWNNRIDDFAVKEEMCIRDSCRFDQLQRWCLGQSEAFWQSYCRLPCHWLYRRIRAEVSQNQALYAS